MSDLCMPEHGGLRVSPCYTKKAGRQILPALDFVFRNRIRYIRGGVSYRVVKIHTCMPARYQLCMQYV